MSKPRSRYTDNDGYGVCSYYRNSTKYTTYPLVSLDNESMNGVDIDDFWKRKRGGELLPLTDFEHFRVKGYGRTPGPFLATKPGLTLEGTDGDDAHYDAYWKLDKLTLKEFAGDAQARIPSLLTASAAKIYAQGHDTFTFLAELHKTARMFRDVVNQARNLIQRGPGSAIESWLAYRYGWRILYYDIVDVQKALANMEGERERFSQRCGLSLADRTLIETREQSWESSIHSITFETKYKVSVRGTVVADIDPPEFRFNPLTTGWEVTKWSFIVDWFLDIGAWFEAMSFLVLQTNHVAAGGIHVSATRKTINHYVQMKDPYTGYFGPSESDVSATYTLRTPMSVPNYPSFGFNIDAFKIIDLYALFLGGDTPGNRT